MTPLTTEKQYKEAGKEETVFSNLFSDTELREKAAKLRCEDESDKRAVDIILANKGFTKFQRNWLNVLIERKGKKFS